MGEKYRFGMVCIHSQRRIHDIDMTILPDVPRLPTARGKIADGVFVLLLLCSRSVIVIGAVGGAMVHGFLGFLAGLVAGMILGLCLSRSLGLRGLDMTQGFHFRMYERGYGKSAGTLEALVEWLRGHRLTMTQCRQITTAYAEAVRQLQSCDSAKERASILAKRNRQVLEIIYGERALANYDAGVEQAEEAPEADMV
jgi:hypothetical protein